MDGFHTLTLGAALYVTQRMRAADAAGVRALLGGITPEVLAMNRFQTHGPAWFLEQGGEPVAILGIEMHHDTCGVAWLICTDQMRSFKKLLRFCRTVGDNAMAKGMRRIEVHTIDGWHQAFDFAKHVGCEVEGIRRNAGHGGESFHVFARIG